MLTEQDYLYVTHDNLPEERYSAVDSANSLINACNYLFIEKML